MEIEIKNRFTKKEIIKGEFTSLREAVEKNKADLRGADLRGANLCEANLYGANLYGANLREADLYRAKIKITQKEELIKTLGIKIED